MRAPWLWSFGAALVLIVLSSMSSPTATAFAQGRCPVTTIPISGRAVPAMADLEQHVSSIMLRMCIPGLAIAVAKDGRLVYARGFGYSNLAAHTAMQPDIMFRVGSVTKSLDGIGIYKLVQDGLVDVDAKVLGPGGYLQHLAPPPGCSRDPRLADVTVRNFLEMSVVWTTTLHSPRCGPFRTRNLTLDQLLRQQMAYDLAFAPGTSFKYTSADFSFLQAIVAARNAQHLSYEPFMKQVIFAPLGMRRIFIGDRTDGVTTPYSNPPVRPLPPLHGYGTGAGGWTTNTIDLMRLMVALRGLGPNPSPLDAATQQQWVGRPQNPYFADKKSYWVSGWDSVTCPICSPGAITNGLITDGVKATWIKGGEVAGGLASYQSSPNGLAFAILINQANGPAMPMLYRNLLVPTVRRVTDWPSWDLFTDYPG